MLAMLMLNRMGMKRRSLRMKQKVLKQIKPEKKAEDCCRTCLSTDDLVSIFYDKETEEKRSNDLRTVTGLEIKMNDGLSQKICTLCIDKMNMSLQFRRISRKAEKALLNMLAGAKPKKRLSKAHKPVLKPPKLPKTKLEQIDYTDYDYNLFGDDFQNDYGDYPIKEESKPKIKQKGRPRKKRLSIPNASSYKCGTCNKEFRMKATYKAHMRFHTNFCVCESCGKRCRNNNQLQEHKRARHGLGRIHTCAYCDYSSATKEALTIHERRHTGERPYICDHCGAAFHRRSNLVQHIAIHLPEKNFQCPICPKREKSQKLLRIHHYKYHSVNKYRYVCPVCQDTFSRPGSARQHLARSHGVPRADQGLIHKYEFQPIEDGPEYLITDAADDVQDVQIWEPSASGTSIKILHAFSRD